MITVLVGMSSWTALTLHIGMKNPFKTPFKTKNMESKYHGNFLIKIHDNKELIKLGFSSSVVLVCIFE